jgi:hypothetical protein
VNQDQRNPRVLGASRSLRVKKLESGGQLRGRGRSLRRRRSADGSVSLSKRPGCMVGAGRCATGDGFEVAPEHSASGTAGCSRRSVANLPSLRWRPRGAILDPQETRCRSSPGRAAQRQRARSQARPEARNTAATVVAEISTESSFFTPRGAKMGAKFGCSRHLRKQKAVSVHVGKGPRSRRRTILCGAG